jgi:formylglycine-generating enzyme required for sulfatase activity
MVVAGSGRSTFTPAKDQVHGVGNILHRSRSLAVYNGTTADLTASLAAVLDKPVEDRTGVKGFYDFELTWDAAPALTVFAAVEAQLGLQLKPDAKVRSDLLVVDHVEAPSLVGATTYWSAVRSFATGCARVKGAADSFFQRRGLVAVQDKLGLLACGSQCLGVGVSASIDARQFRDDTGKALDFERVQQAYLPLESYQRDAKKTTANRGHGFWEHMGPWGVWGSLQYRDQESGCQAQFDFHISRPINQYLLIVPFDRYSLVLPSNGRLEAEAFAAIEAVVGPGRDVAGRQEMEIRQTQLEARLESEGASRRAGAPGIDIEFVEIHPGDFIAGCDQADSKCLNQLPPHRVQIPKAFDIGRYEVTQAQWERVMGTNPSRFKGTDLPVESVTWDDIQSFLGNLNARQDGYLYRLPTEDEWEYAARAGSNSTAPPHLEAATWSYGNSNGHTHPVGQKQPNAWGLYDMFGNVAEFVQDEYIPPLRKASSSAGPTGPEQFAWRVIRGGGFQQGDAWLRVSTRDGFSQHAGFVEIGFRCVRERAPR